MKKYLRGLVVLSLITGCAVQKKGNAVLLSSVLQLIDVNKLENNNIKYELKDLVSMETIELNFKSFAESLNSRPTIEIPKLLFDTEDARIFNEHLTLIAEECKAKLNIENQCISEIHFLNVDCYLTEDILSIVIKHDPWVEGIGGYYSIYEVANFSAASGKRLTNQEIIAKLHLNQEQMQQQVDEMAKTYRDCTSYEKHELRNQCIFTISSENFEGDATFSTNLNDNQYFYIEDQSSAKMYVFLYGVNQQFEQISIQI